MVKSKILLVDDEVKICQLISMFLISQGFLVQTASDGKLALIRACEFEPDCILLDVRMPHGGLGLLSSLRKKLPHSIVIMLSAFIETGQVSDFINKGAYACMEKPVNFDDLLQRIRQALKL
ncbi:MAG: response regulator [Nitrospinae bacterium]|nr:response regulator [Nitrospinota bacterium]MBL7020686.1 response regulator [Nitrospinaceae bacterium]